MKYLITENRMNTILTDLIEDRFSGIKFTRGFFGSILGYLPHQNPEDEWVLAYERGEEDDIDYMILWMYQDDYDYFSAMIPLPEEEILNTIKKWFKKKTRLNADKVNVQ